MKNSQNHLTIIAACMLIAFTSLTRIIDHYPNFTAVGALALFAGVNIRDKRYAFLFPFIAMFIADIYLGFHFSIVPVYMCFALAVWIGFAVRKNKTIFRIFSASIISSVIFFLVTNLPFWYANLQLYPMTLEGTLESYTAALPYFRNQVTGDLIYTALFFGLYEFAFRRIVAYRLAKGK